MVESLDIKVEIVQSKIYMYILYVHTHIYVCMFSFIQTHICCVYRYAFVYRYVEISGRICQKRIMVASSGEEKCTELGNRERGKEVYFSLDSLCTF